MALFDRFYRVGALVFGGGHVVLPMLETEIVPQGWVTQPLFLAGYSAEMPDKEAFLHVAQNIYRFYRQQSKELRFLERALAIGLAPHHQRRRDDARE